MNSFYNMWNMDYVQQQANVQQHHHEQQLQVAETARKLQDFWIAGIKSNLNINQKPQ